MPESQEGYVNFFEVLGLTEDAKTGEVRKVYRRRMKALVAEIARVEITEERRAHYLLEMAKFNAALCVLRDTPSRDAYWEERTFLIDLEAKWRAAAESGGETEDLRRQFDGRVRGFLAKYCDEMMLAAGSDKECVEASYWDAAHERHASRLLRHYRQSLYQKILARLPYSEVTPPKIDWDKRRRVVAAALKERTS
jgi:hypothetical protein